MGTPLMLLIASSAIFSAQVDGRAENLELGLPSPGQSSLPLSGSGPRAGPVPGPFHNFVNQPLNDILNRIIAEALMLARQHGNSGMNVEPVVSNIQAMFISYYRVLEKAGSCATDDMKKEPDEALAGLLTCLPSSDDLRKKGEEAKRKVNELLNKMKEADEEISAITDDLQKLVKAVEVEWTVVDKYFSDMTNKVFDDIATVYQCLSTRRTKIQTDVVENLAELEKCQQE